MEISSSVKKFYTLLQEIVGNPGSLGQAAELMKGELRGQLNSIFQNYYTTLRAKEEQLVSQLGGIVSRALTKLCNLEQSLRHKRLVAEQLKKKIKETDNKQHASLQKEIDAFNDSLVDLDRELQSKAESLTDEYRKQLRQQEHWRVLQRDTTLLTSNRHRRASSSSLKRFNTPSNRGMKTLSKMTNPPSKFARVTEQYDLNPKQQDKENYSSHFGLEYLNNFRRNEQRQTHAHTVQMDLTLNPSSFVRSTSVDRSRQKSPERKLQNQLQIQYVQDLIRQQQPPMLLLTGLHIRDYFIPSILQTFLEGNRKFGVIKLVKNELTDEGLSMLLKGLKNYPYLHTLNLTSNLLTEQSFETITKFRHRNKGICHYYLSGNRINAHRCRGVREKLSEMGINVYF